MGLLAFVPDTAYGNLGVLANRQAFVDDLTNHIENSYWQNQGYYFNLRRSQPQVADRAA